MAGTKRDLRRAVLRRRRERPAEARRRDDEARTAVAVARLPETVRVVAAYVSAPGEPDTRALLAELCRRDVRVLLPVLRGDGPVTAATPDWAAYEGVLRDGSWGFAEPPGPALGPEALAAADLLVLPGLAGTPAGARLGRGGGWYDRALAHARPDAPRWLLLGDDEVLDAVPVEPHDQPVTALVTASRFIVCRPAGRWRRE